MPMTAILPPSQYALSMSRPLSDRGTLLSLSFVSWKTSAKGRHTDGIGGAEGSPNKSRSMHGNQSNQSTRYVLYKWSFLKLYIFLRSNGGSFNAWLFKKRSPSVLCHFFVLLFRRKVSFQVGARRKSAEKTRKDLVYDDASSRTR